MRALRHEAALSLFVIGGWREYIINAGRNSGFRRCFRDFLYALFASRCSIRVVCDLRGKGPKGSMVSMLDKRTRNDDMELSSDRECCIEDLDTSKAGRDDGEDDDDAETRS